MAMAEEVKGDFQAALSRLDLEPTYLTVIASPKAIPYSAMKPDGRWSKQEYRISLDKYYVGVGPDNKPSIPFGRIFAPSVSGTSAYIARDIHNVRSFSRRALSLFPNVRMLGFALGNNPTSYYPSLNSNLQKLDFESECYGDDKVLTRYPVPEADCAARSTDWTINSDEFRNRDIIGFQTHGNPRDWGEVITADKLPVLSSTTMVATSCLTADYYYKRWALPELFALTAINRGALGYFGAVGSVTFSDHYKLSEFMYIDEAIFRLLFAGEDFGSAIKEVLNNSKFNSSDYTLIGDPTVKLYAPNFSSPYIPMSYWDFRAIREKFFVGYDNAITFSVANSEGGVGSSLVAVKAPDNTVSTITPTCVNQAGGTKKCDFTYNPPIEFADKEYYFKLTVNDSTEVFKHELFFELEAEKAFEVSNSQTEFETKLADGTELRKCIAGEKGRIELTVKHELGLDKIKPETAKLTIDGAQVNLPGNFQISDFGGTYRHYYYYPDYSYDLPENPGWYSWSVEIKDNETPPRVARLEKSIRCHAKFDMYPEVTGWYGSIRGRLSHVGGNDKININSLRGTHYPEQQPLGIPIQFGISSFSDEFWIEPKLNLSEGQHIIIIEVDNDVGDETVGMRMVITMGANKNVTEWYWSQTS